MLYVATGDKSSVTVMGHGTGAACLHYLMTSDALPHGNYAQFQTFNSGHSDIFNICIISIIQSFHENHLELGPAIT